MSVRGEELILIEHFLREAPLFATCSEEFIVEFAGNLQTSACNWEEAIVRQGAPCSFMVMLSFGTATILIDDEQVGTLGVKQYIGDVNLLGMAVDSAVTVMPTSSDCRALKIEKHLLSEILDDFQQDKWRFNALAEKYRGSYLDGTAKATCDFLRGMHEETLLAMNSSLENRLLYPDQYILKEGEEGDCMCILVQGQVSVEIAGRIVTRERRGRALDLYGVDVADAVNTSLALIREVALPTCYGELGLLGVKKTRQASVMAESVCQVRILHRSVFLKLLEEQHDAVQGHLPLSRYTDAPHPSRLQLGHLPLFQELSCSEDFLDFLASHLEEKVFLASQKIVVEDTPDDGSMYVIMEGNASAYKAGEKVSSITEGDGFGERVLLGLAMTRASTVIADTTISAKVLPRAVMIRGLELFPQERSHMLQAALGHMAQEGDDARGRRVSSIGANFKEAVKTTPLFLNTSQEFVDELSSQAATRIYLPSDNIIEQGREGNSMFILVTGQANVIVQDGMMESIDIKPVEGGEAESEAVQWREAKVGSLGPGSVFGELTMLGISPTRSATIRAETVCFLWEITQDTALLTIEKHPDAMKHFGDIVVHNLERTVQTRILGMPLFQSFDCKFRTLLSLYCERSVYFPRQRIVREGQVDERMIVVNVGRASLEKKGLMLRVYTQGTCFGAALMLGLEKAYHGSLIVMQTCHILSVTRRSYLQALDRYPSTAAAQELKRVEQEQAEEFRRAVKQAHVKRKAWKSCEGAAEAESVDKLVRVQGVMKGWLQKTNTSIEDWLHSVLQAWCTSAQQIRERRDAKENERQKCLEQQNRWLQRQVAGRKHREEVQKLQVEKDPNRSALSSLASSTTRLPQVPPKSARTARLEALKTDWPQPRKSPYYNLRFWCVLADAEAELPAIRNGGAQKATERTPRNEA
mmetsp:Transcript_28220/g.62405  ORF Transcript_28220/g.62405 Transcript_28220/m.62405 type:complete len:924 (-) Transcript_28220:133-2904(-)